jgi:FAD dependent oxidoreductase
MVPILQTIASCQNQAVRFWRGENATNKKLPGAERTSGPTYSLGAVRPAFPVFLRIFRRHLLRRRTSRRRPSSGCPRWCWPVRHDLFHLPALLFAAVRLKGLVQTVAHGDHEYPEGRRGQDRPVRQPVERIRPAAPGHEEDRRDQRHYHPPGELDRHLRFLSRHVPGFLGPELYTKTCLYTTPPDHNFVIDTLPDYPQIAVAIGAGHAYKFAGLIGRILCELTMDGSTRFPIEGFRMERPAITDPAFEKAFHV